MRPRVTSVTGTNGKTSTVEFVRQLASGAGERAASYGNLGVVTADGRDPNPRLPMGSGGAERFIRRLGAQGVDLLAMETYSSALAADLYAETTVETAAFTNLSRDHLDVHGSMEAYLAAKLRLFESVLAADGTAVVNRDDDRFDRIAAVCRDRGVDLLTFGRGAADVRLRAVTPTATGTRYEIAHDGTTITADTPLVGEPMGMNVCCAVACRLASGADPSTVWNGLSELTAPPGRLERVAARDGWEAFVDYAHTPDALRTVLRVLCDRADGDLVAIYGCGGDRDPGKRAEMGAIGARHADRVIVTDDNPRTEDPAGIRADVLAGCPDAREIGSRRAAIETGLATLSPGDVLVVAGKGHEETQIRDGVERGFSDRAVVREIVAADG